MFKKITILYFLLFNSLYAQNKLSIENIDEIVNHINKCNLRKSYHAHYQLYSIKMVSVGGEYIESFVDEKNNLSVITCNGGKEDFYEVEKYYFWQDKLVYCNLQENLWKTQEFRWKLDCYFIDEEIIIKNKTNKTNENIDFLKTINYKKTKIENYKKNAT